MQTRLLTTEKLSEDTYKWTLTSRLGRMLQEAEYSFGPRDCSYTLLGIEFIDEKQPCIWYPRDSRNIIIRLTFLAAECMSEACYQLAQETIHLLALTKNVNYLEEGISIYFALDYMKKEFPDYKPDPSGKYGKALELVKPLMEKDADCIRKLRKIQPSFADMEPENIKEVFPELKPEKISCLLEKFNK